MNSLAGARAEKPVFCGNGDDLRHVENGHEALDIAAQDEEARYHAPRNAHPLA